MKSQVLENLEPVLWYVAETVVGQRQVDQIGGRFERLPRRLAEPVQVGVVGYVEMVNMEPTMGRADMILTMFADIAKYIRCGQDRFCLDEMCRHGQT